MDSVTTQRRTIRLNVIRSRSFTKRANTVLVQVSENEFKEKGLDYKKLYNKLRPELWIHVDSAIDIPTGKQRFDVCMNGDIQNYRFPATSAHVVKQELAILGTETEYVNAPSILPNSSSELTHADANSKNNVIELNVLESRVYTVLSNIILVKISNDEFRAKKLDVKKIHNKLLPEIWIYINSSIDIPLGKQQFSVHLNKNIQNYCFPAIELPAFPHQTFNSDAQLNDLVAQLVTKRRECPPHKYKFACANNHPILFCKKCGTIIDVPIVK